MTAFPPPRQPTDWRPTRKVTAATLAGLVWVVVVAICARVGVDLGAGVEASVAALLVGLAGYWTPEGS